MVVENNTHGGITILTPDASEGAIYFGTSSDSLGALMNWDHNDNQMNIGTHNADGFLSFRTDVYSERMRIDKDGNVGIGTESPSYALEVAGSFYSSGSSVDFKKHVTDMAIDSSAIYDLNPVSYEYKKDYENFGYDLAGGKQVGLLSEDVANTVPELAIMKDGKAQNVDYQKLSVLLLAEMKKLNKRLEALEAQ